MSRPATMRSYTRVDPDHGPLSLRPLTRTADLPAWLTWPTPADPHHDLYLGTWMGTPAFVAESWELRPGAVGMRYACVRPDLDAAVRATVLAWLFHDPATDRVVVEDGSTVTR